MKKKINIGVIGVGNGGSNHARTLKHCPQVRLHALADAEPERLSAVAAELEVPRRYDDWRALIGDPEIDAVILATPPFLRMEMFLAAAKAGKHILAEKPLGVNLEQARRMACAAREAGVKAMVNFGTRNLPTYKKLRALIESGDYGKPQWIWFKYYLVANARHFKIPGWFWRKEQSGGHLCENAGHAFDLICEIMGSVDSVTGATARLPIEHFGEDGQPPSIENVGVAILRHAQGGMTVLSNGSNPAGEWGMSFDIVTDTSVISVTRDRTIDIMRDGERVFHHVSRVGWNPIPYGTRAFVRFLTGRSGADSIATPEDGVRAMEIADAAYRSASAGQLISLSS